MYKMFNYYATDDVNIPSSIKVVKLCVYIMCSVCTIVRDSKVACTSI